MEYRALLESIVRLHHESVACAALAVNQALVIRNWAICAYLVKFEQKGKDRAVYGDGLLRSLSNDLVSRGVRGCNPDMLERMRLFFRRYPQLAGHASASGTENFRVSAAGAKLSAISAPPVRKSVRAWIEADRAAIEMAGMT
jgi:hypothetical protein